jgi:CheY-like chemotaxis protein
MKRKRTLNILVIENHQDTLEAMKMFLDLNGHCVHAAGTMRAGLEAASTNAFDLIITDIGLPDGDGWELMRQLRERGPVRAVAMSGYGWKEDLEKSRAAGFEAHLLKPLKVSDLEAVLRKIEQEASSEAGGQPKRTKSRASRKAELAAR